MSNKMKICKGTGQAKGSGCGAEFVKRKYGLCQKCLRVWATTELNGLVWLKKQTAYRVKEKKKEVVRKEKKETFKKKIELMSSDKYRSKYVQPLVNKIARYIDYGNPCVPTGNYEGKMAGGHYTSVGSNRTICLNLHNIFIQSFASNSWKGGDDKKYRASLKRIFGIDYLEFIEGLNSHRSIQLRKPQLIEIKKVSQKIALELEKNLFVRTPLERIEKRNEVNSLLSIYDKEYCIYK